MRLGLWRDALAVLSRSYPAPRAEEIEPGLPLPQNHPMVAYYRAFCRKKLGEPAAADYEIARKLPTAYVFPNGAQTLAVLEDAARERPRDATAHFLLGMLRLSSGLADDAIGEWRTAHQLNPGIPVLDASLGRTLLLVKHDAQGAAAGRGAPGRAGLRFGARQCRSRALRQGQGAVLQPLRGGKARTCARCGSGCARSRPRGTPRTDAARRRSGRPKRGAAGRRRQPRDSGASPRPAIPRTWSSRTSWRGACRTFARPIGPPVSKRPPLRAARSRAPAARSKPRPPLHPGSAQEGGKVIAGPRTHEPVTAWRSEKNAFLRAVLMPQFTGGHWYPSM